MSRESRSRDWLVQTRRQSRRPVRRWIVYGVLFVALTAGVFLVLPRLGGLKHDAAGSVREFALMVHRGLSSQVARLWACGDGMSRVGYGRGQGGLFKIRMIVVVPRPA